MQPYIYIWLNPLWEPHPDEAVDWGSCVVLGLVSGESCMKRSMWSGPSHPPPPKANSKNRNTTVKQKATLADMRLRFLFGVGFLVPNAEKYLCKIYPLASTETAFPDKIYIYLKRLSDATKVYPVLSSSYKRLSGVFHALSGRFGKARTKFDQAIEFAKVNLLGY